MFFQDQRLIAQVGQRRISAAHGHRETHAGGRPRSRFLWCCEIGVTVHIREPYRASGGAAYTQQAAKHDAAVTTDEDDEAAVRGGRSNTIGERCAVGRHFGFVAHAAWRTLAMTLAMSKSNSSAWPLHPEALRSR